MEKMDDLEQYRTSDSMDEDDSKEPVSGVKVGGKGRRSKQRIGKNPDGSKDSRFLNQNSSTAMGTNLNHGNSLHIDTTRGDLKHNSSIEQPSPGNKSLKSGMGNIAQ